MKTPYVFAALAAGAFGFAVSAIVAATAPSPATAAAPPAAGKAAAPAAGKAAPAAPAPLEILEFKPGFADLMTMIVQPRHIKLWLAGQQRNWTLAGFELNELGAALRKVGATIPKYRNISVDATMASIFQPRIQALASSITGQNPMNFNTAFNDLTAACNLCHEALDHPFLVIKVPDASAAAAYPNQSFTPVPGAPAPGAATKR